MAGRRSTGKKGSRSSRPTYQVGEKSDVSYVEDARRRMAREGRRRLIVRLVALAIVVIAGFLWGPTLVNIVRARASQQAGELRDAGDRLEEGRDRRSGANVNVDE